MSAKTPIRTVFDGSNNATGLAEFQSGEFIALSHGGLGASLSIGSAGQVLKVNSGASALEFGTVEAVINVDGMTDGTGITIADTDKLIISDAGTEKMINASQLRTYVQTNTGNTPITNLDIDGGTDIGAALAAADLIIVDNGAGGTNRKATAQRVSDYVHTTVSGGTGISASASSNVLTIAIDTGTTVDLSTSQTLTNKTLTSPVIANITSTADIALTATDDVNIPANVGLTFGDDGEKIEGDGTDLTIASSNDVTIDAAAEINLDTGSDSVRFKDDGTEYGRIHQISGGGLVIKSQQSDKDLRIEGNDGGSSIVALTFDMSEAGNA